MKTLNKKIRVWPSQPSILTGIPFLICLALLLLNDFYLKETYHNWLTGKLSDVCGLFVFVTFWTAFFPTKKLTIYSLTAILFVVWKSPTSQPFIDFFSRYVFEIQRVVDVTDLLALLILPIAFFQRSYLSTKLKISPIPIAILTVFSFCATSLPVPRQVFQQPQYVLFTSAFTSISTNKNLSQFEVYEVDSLTVIGIKEIVIDEEPVLKDEFQKARILKDIDLRFLREIQEDRWEKKDLTSYSGLKTSLTKAGETFLRLERDSLIDELNFEGTRLDGAFKRYSIDNQLLIEGQYKQGIEDSAWTFYNSQGEPILRKTFKHGELVQKEVLENTHLISSQTISTREEKIGDKYFYLALLFLLMVGLIIQMSRTYRNSSPEDIIHVPGFLKVAGTLILPIGTLILAKVISFSIPNSYSTFFLEIIIEVVIIYVITTPLFFLVFYYLKLRSKLDMLLYVFLFALGIVFFEELLYVVDLTKI